MVSNLSENLYETEKNYDLARLRLLHKSCWVDFPLDNPDWTVLCIVYTVHVLPPRIMQNFRVGKVG